MDGGSVFILIVLVIICIIYFAKRYKHMVEVEKEELRETEKEEEKNKMADLGLGNHKDIFSAVGHGTLEDVRYFVEQKRADVNAVKDNHTVLEYALVIGKNPEVIKYIVSRGATIDPDLLLDATQMEKDSLKIVKLFVENGISVNYRDGLGLTPLHMSAKNKDIEVAKYLISKGADINAKTYSKGITPLQLAEEHGNSELVKYLSELKP